MAVRLWPLAFALMLTAPLPVAAVDVAFPAVIAGRTYALPLRVEPVTDAAGDPGLHVVVDLAPILNDRRALLQAALARNDRCGLSVEVDDVILSPAPPGAHVRIEANFIGTICRLGIRAHVRHHSHADATLTPVVADHRRIFFTAHDGQVSGEIARAFRGDIRRWIEEAVQRSFPSFDVDSALATLPFVPSIQIQDARLTGAGNAWQIETNLALNRRP